MDEFLLILLMIDIDIVFGKYFVVVFVFMVVLFYF